MIYEGKKNYLKIEIFKRLCFIQKYKAKIYDSIATAVSGIAMQLDSIQGFCS